MVKNKKRFKKFISVIAILLATFAVILGTCSSTIAGIKESKQEQIEDARKRDFEVIWGILQSYLNESRVQTTKIASSIESELRSTFDLNDLKNGLDNNDEYYEEAVYEIIRDNIDHVHFGDINNNRNSMLVLEGYNTIVEDFLIDPDSREESKKDIQISGNDLIQYKDTTYNPRLFSTAIQKIRNHTTGIIAIEPYNYIKNDDNHIMIPEMNYANLEKVYVAEGMEGIKNYQFLVPVYITDTGDIFGQQDIEHGVRKDTHKYIVIQTFNLYDQLTSVKPDIGDDDYIGRITARYDSILNALYVLGIVVCAMITVIVIYSFNIYNLLIESNHDFFGSKDHGGENKNT